MDTDVNEKQNGQPIAEKKKLNKRERKEARQQKNGKAAKGAEKTATQEMEEDQGVKKGKKDRKRGHDEASGDYVENGHDAASVMSSKKTKSKSNLSEYV